MELTWPLVLVVGLLALAATVVLAWLLPFRGAPASLPRVSRSYRLTRLPKYQRARRAHRALVLALVVVVLLFSGAAVFGVARPYFPPQTKTTKVQEGDVIICTSGFFDPNDSDPAARNRNSLYASLYQFLRGKVADLTREQLGVSAKMQRPIPLTGDKTYLTESIGRFADYGKNIGELQGKKGDDPDRARFASDAARFTGSDSRNSVTFKDYSVNDPKSGERMRGAVYDTDRLGFCLSGFPKSKPGDPPRSLIVFDKEDRMQDPKYPYLDHKKYSEAIRNHRMAMSDIKPLFEEKDLLDLAKSANAKVSLVFWTDNDPNDPQALGPGRVGDNPLDDAHDSAFKAVWRESGGVACRFFAPSAQGAAAPARPADQVSADAQRCLQSAWDGVGWRGMITSTLDGSRKEAPPMAIMLVLALSLAGLYIRAGA
ncbi:hypothetical protein [Segniliparus rugosus]|uniref:Uncharacterized protein n=1 Tax=Segniliparus rugosus (strain ATCC BAA-974 / DSM 45345 / CCUG 50838 / CIP 108380 / JCM 13579 / CDC 945) TaxID=679197 RepID=E5XKK8_SEGRC|nr:hypothetical protein [Segniliparus rugosus]EFV15120.1 hypothetical protein HMPREF9336_00027 [Segniliparus rugosus ATCC BAA-974]